MTVQLQPFFAAQAQLLSQGRISTLSRAYALPLAVYLPRTGQWHLLTSRPAIVEVFWEKYRGVSAAGVGRLQARVIEESWKGRRRAAVEVMWFYIGAHGRKLGRTRAGYYLTLSPGGPRIDMMEFREIAFPQLHDWFADNSSQIVKGKFRFN
jgi:hypothetical protein